MLHAFRRQRWHRWVYKMMRCTVYKWASPDGPATRDQSRFLDHGCWSSKSRMKFIRKLDYVSKQPELLYSTHVNPFVLHLRVSVVFLFNISCYKCLLCVGLQTPSRVGNDERPVAESASQSWPASMRMDSVRRPWPSAAPPQPVKKHGAEVHEGSKNPQMNIPHFCASVCIIEILLSMIGGLLYPEKRTGLPHATQPAKMPSFCLVLTISTCLQLRMKAPG